MDEMEERRMAIANLRTRLELLENERRNLLREIASSDTPLYRRAEALVRRAELQQDREEALRALRNLGEPVDEN